MGWKLIPLADTGLVEVSLRRFSSPSGPGHYHDASAVVEHQVPGHFSAEGYMEHIEPSAYAGDPKWPTKCSCGYEFTPEDTWQVNEEVLMRAPDGTLMTASSAPIGACWTARWMTDVAHYNKGEPMWPLVIKCPPGHRYSEWGVDLRAGGGGWRRGGPIEKLTVAPSIRIGNEFHSFVKNGILLDDIEGKKFPQYPPTA